MKLITALFAAALLLPGAAFAQSTSSSNSNHSQASQSSSMNGTNSTNSSQSSMNSSNGSQSNQELEGCVTRRETDYYITPESGGAPIRLRGSQDLSTAENHHARVSGHYENNQNDNNENNSSASTMNNNNNSTAANSGSNMSSSNNANNGNDFMVTEVKSVTESCPANGSH